MTSRQIRGLSRYLNARVLNGIFQGAPVGVERQFVSLHTSDPGASGANEVAGGSYARQEASFTRADPGVDGTGDAENEDALEFDGMPSLTVVGFGVWDAELEGNFLWGGLTEIAQDVKLGDAFRVRAGWLGITFVR